MEQDYVIIAELNAKEKRVLRDQIIDKIKQGDFSFDNEYTDADKEILYTNQITKLLKDSNRNFNYKKIKSISANSNTNNVKKDKDIVDEKYDYENIISIEDQIKLTNKDKKILREKLTENKITNNQITIELNQKKQNIEQVNTQINSLLVNIHELDEKKQKAEQELLEKHNDIELLLNGNEDECIDKIRSMGLAAQCGLCLCLVRNNCVILPCFHSSFCEECLIGITTCPMCRVPIKQYNRLFNV